MYTALLVDDEPWALKGISNSFNWEKYGVNHLYETTSSSDAMNIMLSKNPDIVFSDIAMSGYSGLDLARKSQEEDMNTEFVLVSGYDEFKFAKEALKCNVFEYLLKPIDLDEAEQLLIRLTNRLNEKALTNFDLSVLLSPVQDIHKLKKHLFINGLGKRYSHYQIAVVSGNWDVIRSIIHSIPDTVFVTIKIGSRKYALFFNNDSDAYETVSRSEHPKLGETSWGFCPQFENIEQISTKYREAETSYYDYFIKSKFDVYRFNGSESHATPACLDKILKYVENDKLDSAQRIIMKQPQIFAENNYNIMHLTFFFNQIIAFLSYRYYSLYNDYNFMFTDFDQLVNSHKGIYHVCKYLAEAISLINKDVSSADPGYVNFQWVIEYIRENYHLPLYLEDLSKKFHINITYICDLFKKHTGSTYTDYISQIRLEKACELLMSSGLSIHEIAEKVGYSDYYYFNKVFKKRYDITAARFRKVNN